MDIFDRLYLLTSKCRFGRMQLSPPHIFIYIYIYTYILNWLFNCSVVWPIMTWEQGQVFISTIKGLCVFHHKSQYLIISDPAIALCILFSCNTKTHLHELCRHQKQDQSPSFRSKATTCLSAQRRCRWYQDLIITLRDNGISLILGVCTGLTA